MSGPEYVERFVNAADGLRLFARDYGAASGNTLPVVCLPGLSRNSADFHELAVALATDADRPRRVLALDYRGRGRSDYDPDPRKYDVAVELADVVAVLAALGIARATFVGTSRGGLLTMALAATKPDAVAGAVLNDIGPAIEGAGLVRIRSYVGKLPQPRDRAEAGTILKSIQWAQFPGLSEAQWQPMAKTPGKRSGEGSCPTTIRRCCTAWRVSISRLPCRRSGLFSRSWRACPSWPSEAHCRTFFPPKPWPPWRWRIHRSRQSRSRTRDTRLSSTKRR